MPFNHSCIFIKGKTVNIYTYRHYAFGMVHDFRMLGNMSIFLSRVGIKLKTAPLSKIY